MNIAHRFRGDSDTNRTRDYRSRCGQCLLPETFPRISFDEDHVCNHCTTYQKKDKERKAAWKKKRSAWVEEIIERKRNKGKYDCLVSYSGGKDSTYLLYLLKEKYGLKVLAYTCDTGFMSEAAHRNIKRTLGIMQVDHIWQSPGDSFYRKLYSHMFTHPKNKRRYVKTVCGECFKVTSLQALKIAIEKDIPLVAYGFSPAQLNKSVYCMTKLQLMLTFLPLDLLPNKSFPIKLTSEERRHFYIGLRDLRKMPTVLFPFQVFDYDIPKIKETISSLGLIAPGDEHPLYSNCLINLLMIELDSARFRYHPYASEFSQLVREGQIDRQEWLDLENKIVDEIENRTFSRKEIDHVLARLGLTNYYNEFVAEALGEHQRILSNPSCRASHV